MKSHINFNSSDINTILRLFAPKNYAAFVFDPHNLLNEDEELQMVSGNKELKLVLINFASDIQSYKGIALEEFDVILNFGKTDKSLDSSTYYLLPGNDKSIKVLSKGSYKAASPFYLGLSFKQKMQKAALRMLLMSGVVASKCFKTLSVQTKVKSATSAKALGMDALFLGTKGMEQTPIGHVVEKGKSTRFCRFALSPEGQVAMTNEAFALASVSEKISSNIPQVLDFHSSYLETSSLLSGSSKQSDKFTKAHAQFLTSLTTGTEKYVDATDVKAAVLKNLPNASHSISMNHLSRMARVLVSKLEGNQYEFVQQHGDFTPWNCLLNQGTLSVFDWEKSGLKPAHFDLIHFHVQKWILTENSSSTEFYNNLSQLADVQYSNMKFDVSFDLYLLHVISEQLAVYSSQNELSKNQQTQVLQWTELVKLSLTLKSSNYRLTFLTQLANDIKFLDYSAMKFDLESFSSLPDSSDLDFAMTKTSTQQFIEIIKSHVLVSKVHTVKSSFMTVVHVYFKDGGFLSVDCIHQFKRKANEFLSVEDVLSNRIKISSGVYVANSTYDLAYVFGFYNLNNGEIPSRYKWFYNGLDSTQKVEALLKINEVFGVHLTQFEEIFEKQALTSRFSLLNAANYVADSVKKFFNPSGFIITFTGVDGAGKSTLIELTRQKLENQFRKEVVLLRHRPGLLPILSAAKHGKDKAEQLAGTNLPRKGNNKSVLSSLLRFAYYFADYQIGQVYVYFKYLCRGKVVLYDRYYFDFIHDLKRSNIRLNPKFTKALYPFIFKARLNIFLYAKAEDILKRKQELDKISIETLTKKYQGLFDEFGKNNNRYVSIENKEIDGTLKAIVKAYQKAA